MTLYDILGVEPNAPDDEIKTAYRNLIKAFHPDYYHGDKAFANRKTNEVVTAYETLRDPQKRREYDAALGIKTAKKQEPPPQEPKIDVAAQVRQEIDQLNSAYTTRELLNALSAFSNAVNMLNKKITALNLPSEQRNQLHEMLFYMARSKAVALYNEQAAAEQAVALTNSLIGIFFGFSSLREILENDLKTLNKEIQKKKDREREKAIREAREKERMAKYIQEKSIQKEIEDLNCAYPNGNIGSDVSILAEFTESIDNLNKKILELNLQYEQKNKLREALFYMAYPKANYLHKCGKNAGAQAVLRVLKRMFSDMPALCAVINRDIAVMDEAIEKAKEEAVAKEAKRKRARATVCAILLIGVFWVGMYYLGGKIFGEHNSAPTSGDVGSEIHIDIQSIYPAKKITSKETYFICKCKTTSSEIVWVYITAEQYQSYFDGSVPANFETVGLDEVTFFSSKRIEGTTRSADSILWGLSSEIGSDIVIALDPTVLEPIFDPATIPTFSVDSSCFSQVGYDARHETLLVCFRDSGAYYCYYDFTQEDYDDFIAADSLGAYYNEYIKGYYHCEKLLD